MEKVEETKYFLNRTCGLLNFLGGHFDTEKLSKMPFGDVVDSIFRNGGVFTVKLSKDSEAVSNNIREERDRKFESLSDWKVVVDGEQRITDPSTIKDSRDIGFWRGK